MTIIVGYVNTPDGRAALDTAIAEAKKHDSSVIVVNASRPVVRRDSHRLGEKEVAEVESILAEAGVSGEIRSPGSELDPAEQIIATAAEVGAQLVVLGTRKRTPVGKFLLGSTVQKVIIDAVCPVLCVKAEY
ncbi:MULTISPECIES: universal stress protein [Brevibacterium]|uniref:Universal stress protein n=1 Tax=Brevibacterium casei TaxID=33889 RepID=A0A7T4DJN5_9MICO|nr:MULTISPECIES: universal stress protein [Brevibacterium]QQB14571.1 universal stress protein [Brevibacterium casei]|tara:strand:- start:126 stop:521 length:396 start_codon:yes stop_codon:yes gene_type:complete